MTTTICFSQLGSNDELVAMQKRVTIFGSAYVVNLTVTVLLPPPTYRGAVSEYAALAMPRLAHISGRAA